MRSLITVVALGGALLAVGAGSVAAANMAQTVKLHPPANVMHVAMHAMGTAKVSYTAHDSDIKLTTDGLPAPSALHEKAYVLWLVNGGNSVNAGALKMSGMMASVHAMTMDTVFTKLVVTAEKSAVTKHSMGPKVLVGTVMHH